MLAAPQSRAAAHRNVAALLWDAADRGHGAAVVDERGTHVYAALASCAGAVAAALRAEGVRAGDRVAVLLDRGADAVAAYFGVLAAGGVAVVVNDRLRPRQIEHALAHCAARALVTSPAMLARQPRPLRTEARVLDVAGLVGHGGDGGPLTADDGAVAQLIYTSGSTGLPKGVTFTHGALAAGTRAVAAYLGLRADDRIASLLPLSSVYGLNQLLGATCAGAALVVETSPLAHQITLQLRAAAVTVLAAVPPLWLQLLRTPLFVESPMPALRVLQNAGGHLPTEAVRRLRAAHPAARLFLQYGMTETFRSTFLPPEEVDRHPGSIGRAVPGSDVFVVRDDLSECGVDEVGELVHRGPSMAAGYWEDPEASARVFRPDPRAPSDGAGRAVFSGDMVRRDAEGLLHYVGRRDRIIKSLGFRIGPDEIVDVLHASGAVTEAVVGSEPDEQRGDRIVAWVVLAPGGSAERVHAFCRAELPRHMQPARVDVRAELPRLASGKYDLAALLAPGAGAG